MKFNPNISALFGGLNKNSFNPINLNDYALIKSGSYKKLLKAAYANDKKTDTEKDSVVNKKNSVDKTGLSVMKKEADALKTASEALSKDELWSKLDTEAGKADIVSAVKNFAREYNDSLEQASKISSKEISQTVRFMGSMTNVMSKVLDKAGITVGTDGKLSVNEKTLSDNVKTAQSLFQGAGSYGAQIKSYAADISKNAVSNSNLYDASGAATNLLPGSFETWT